MTKQSGIYKITHTQSGKCYVGSAVCIKERIAGHKSYLKHGKHPNAKLQHAWTKYGCDAFLFEVIEVVDEKTNLISREQFWMDALDAIRGFNIAPKAGSSLGRKATEETRKKLSEIHKGRPPHPNLLAAITGRKFSDETKRKIGASNAGKPKKKHTPEQRAARSAWQLGRKHSQESKAKISSTNKGRFISEESRAKMSESHKGVAISDDQRKKISMALMGRKVSDATRAKISAAHAGKMKGPLLDSTKALLSSRMKGRVWTADEIAKRVATRAANKAMRTNSGQAFQA